MKVLYERVAGIDVHKEMVKVAIRSPGEKPWTRTTEVLEFRTFYGVLQEMARELRRRGVTHVVMEASGVYTEPVYHALTEQDFAEVLVVNPAHVKALKGHKTDPLTELPGEVPQVSGRMGVLVATVADHDHRRRCAAGPVQAGDAAGRVA
jgi:transposase